MKITERDLRRPTQPSAAELTTLSECRAPFRVHPPLRAKPSERGADPGWRARRLGASSGSKGVYFGQPGPRPAALRSCKHTRRHRNGGNPRRASPTPAKPRPRQLGCNSRVLRRRHAARHVRESQHGPFARPARGAGESAAQARRGGHPERSPPDPQEGNWRRCVEFWLVSSSSYQTPKLQTLDPKPQNLDPKPQNLNPKP